MLLEKLTHREVRCQSELGKEGLSLWLPKAAMARAAD